MEMRGAEEAALRSDTTMAGLTSAPRNHGGEKSKEGTSEGGVKGLWYQCSTTVWYLGESLAGTILQSSSGHLSLYLVKAHL